MRPWGIPKVDSNKVYGEQCNAENISGFTSLSRPSRGNLRQVVHQAPKCADVLGAPTCKEGVVRV